MEPCGGGESLETKMEVALTTANVVILPDQLQFTPDPVEDATGKLVLDKVGRIATLLPHTPYAAAGLNFVWHLLPDPPGFGEFCRSLFFRDNPLFSAFEQGDARYGGYLSKNTLGTRLKLDVRPVKATAPDGTEVLQFAFNFNLDLRRNPAAVEQIIALLGRWDEAKVNLRVSSKQSKNGDDSRGRLNTSHTPRRFPLPARKCARA